MKNLKNPHSKTIALTTPIVRGDTTISEITVNKPKVGALRGLSLADVIKMDVDAINKLIPRVTTPALVEHEICDMDLADYTSVTTEIIGFFAPPTEQN